MQQLQLNQSKISRDIENFRFGEAYDQLYHFVWDDLADWYIEASKTEPNKALLAYLLEQVLIITHPFAPFLTETIWQTLKWDQDTLLAAKIIETTIKCDSKLAKEFNEIQNIVKESRGIIKALGAKNVSLHFDKNELIANNSLNIKFLARLKSIEQGVIKDGFALTSTSNAWLNIDQDMAKKYARDFLGIS